MIDFYCGLTDVWYVTDFGGKACISPVRGTGNRKKASLVYQEIQPYHRVLLDSGAFSDSVTSRLSFGAAVERQLCHAEKYNYVGSVEYLVAYDVLIDETWLSDDIREKRRWSVQDAEWAVKETIKACEFLAKNYSHFGLCLPCQGVDAEQYLVCSKRVIPLLREKDVLGLGGWCIIGKQRKFLQQFYRTMWKVIPDLAKSKSRRAHLFGVMYAPALGALLWVADQYDVKISTDSIGPVVRPTRGDYGYMGWYSHGSLPSREEKVDIVNNNIKDTINWLAGFRNTPWYKEPPREFAEQLFLF